MKRKTIYTLLTSLLFMAVSYQVNGQDNHAREIDPSRLAKAIVRNLGQTEEFDLLRQVAEQRGIRIWLSGGTAHTYAMYVKHAELGLLRSQPGFRLEDIFRATQDIDIIVDGSEEDASYLEQFSREHLGQHNGRRSAWEFRLLRGSYKNKEPLLDPNSQFLKRHSDSASLGFVELSTPPQGEPRIRDLRNWEAMSSEFLADAAAGRIRLYYSENHKSTRLYQMGHNPPILEAVRFLAKAVQHGLEIDSKDYEQIKKIIDEYDAKTVLEVEYPRRWLIRNGSKLVYAAQDLADSAFLLEDSGLRKVLMELEHPADANHRYSDMAKQLRTLLQQQPLFDKPVGEGSGKTASELGLTAVHYRSESYRQYELLKFTPARFINLFTKPVKTSDSSEIAGVPLGKGTGKQPINGFYQRFTLVPEAREGSDFLVTESDGQEVILLLNSAAVKRSERDLSPFAMDALSYLELLTEVQNRRNSQKSYTDFRIIERLSKSVGWDRSVADAAAKKIDTVKPDDPMLRDWFKRKMSLDFPEIVEALAQHRSYEIYAQLFRTFFIHKHWLDTPVADRVLQQIFDDLVDPSRLSEEKRDTALKDLFKASALGARPGIGSRLETIAATDASQPLFIERFLGRADPKNWRDYFDLLASVVHIVKNDAGKLADVIEALGHNHHIKQHMTNAFLAKLKNETRTDQQAKMLVALAESGKKASSDPNATSALPGPKKPSQPPTITKSNASGDQAGGAPDSGRKGKRPPAPPKPHSNSTAGVNNVNNSNGGGPAINSNQNSGKRPPKRPKGPSISDQLASHKAAGPFLAAVKEIKNDIIAAEEAEDRVSHIYGREEEAAKVLDTLVRIKGKNPVLIGDAGVGKTAVADLIAQMIYYEELPEAAQYQEHLLDAVVVQTTPALISKLAMANTPNAQAAAVETFIASLKASEEILNRRIILYVDEMHMFEGPQLEALKTTFDSKDGILFIGSSTSSELMMMIGRNDALRRRLKQILVPEFSKEETKQLLLETVVPVLEREYGSKSGPGTITEDAVDMAIRRAVEYEPSVRRPEAPYKLLMDAMIDAHRRSGATAPELNADGVAKYVVGTLKLPLDPTNLATFNSGLEELREKMYDTVVEQPQIVDAMIDLWREAYFSSTPEDGVKVLLIAGPTGAGKTFSARTFAQLGLGSEARMLEIDATKYSTGGHSLNSLIGAPNGIISSNETKGVLPEFLNGRGKGMNVIVINELDKAHPDLAQTLMEMMDTGKLQGGDGRTYYTGRSLIVITTNKGDDRIYPRDYAEPLTRKEIEARVKHITDDQVRQWFMEPDGKDMYDQKNNQAPSVLQRIDRATIAVPVSQEGAEQVVENKLNRVIADIADNHGFRAEVDDAVIARLVEAHYVPENGVRAVEREAQKLIYDAIKSTEGEIGKGDTIHIALSDRADGAESKFVVEIVPSEQPGREPDMAGAGVATAASVQGEGAPNLDDGGRTNGPEPARQIGEMTAPRSRQEVDNPFADEEVRNRVVGLEERLDQHVFGQTEATTLAARAIRVKQINAQNHRPASLLFLGSTGIGKTELAKAIAREVYGNEGRMATFDMGSVKWEGDFNNIFSPPKGFVGSSKVSPFEKFLMDFPEGGVVLFDEIGNMGGGDRRIKEDLLMRFYAMLDEGKWRSVHGKEYPLRNITFVFTSNEGQERFYNLPSDDLRMAAWEEARNKEHLHQLLREAGWPEALIGRITDMSLFKPLLNEDREAIAEAQINGVLKEQMRQHKIGEFHVSEDFYSNVAEAFYSHSKGARSIRRFAENQLTDLIGTALADLYNKHSTLRNTSMTFDFSDSYKDLLMYEGNFPPQREVELTLTAETEGKRETYSADLSGDAAEKRLVTPEELRVIAYHEAGHAVANDPKLTGEVVGYVTIQGSGHYGGYARFESIGSSSLMTREMVIARIGRMLAGGEAESRYLSQAPSGGRASDLEGARKLAEAAVTKMGLAANPLEMPAVEGKVNPKSAKVQAEIQNLLKAGEQYAQQIVDDKWSQVEELAEALEKHQFIDREGLDKILTEQEGLKTRKKASNGDRFTALGELMRLAMREAAPPRGRLEGPGRCAGAFSK